MENHWIQGGFFKREPTTTSFKVDSFILSLSMHTLPDCLEDMDLNYN